VSGDGHCVAGEGGHYDGAELDPAYLEAARRREGRIAGQPAFKLVASRVADSGDDNISRVRIDRGRVRDCVEKRDQQQHAKQQDDLSILLHSRLHLPR